MIFRIEVGIYKDESYQAYDVDGNPTKIKKSTGRCTFCHKKIPSGSVILTQHYTTRFGHGKHKYCPDCSEKGMRELKETTKDIKFRNKIGWDHY